MSMLRLEELLGYKQLALTDDGVLHGAVEFYERCIQMNSTDSRIGVAWEELMLLERNNKWSHAKSAKGYESPPETFNAYQQGAYFGQRDDEWIATHSEGSKSVLLPMDSEWGLQSMGADSEAVLGAVKEEYAGVEIAVGITREMVERSEFDTMREGIGCWCDSSCL